MADHDSIVSSDKIKAVADAIREKTHKDNLMTLDEMPDEIASISGGGGNVPECGIVPTSWASNGFVLTVDTYGDIMPGALCGGASDEGYAYPDTLHVPNVPENIDITRSDLQSFVGQQICNYLKSVTFATDPEFIGNEAFMNQYWLTFDALPENVEYIGKYAFTNCFNLYLDVIPASVNSIQAYAFSGSNQKEKLVPYYSTTSTYDVGDIVFNMDNSTTYTCITSIEVPENFDSSKWVEGYYPEFLEVYDNTHTYTNGDIVYDSDNYSVCTCCYIMQPSNYVVNNCPEILGVWDSTTTYNPGDVVAYADEFDGTYYICTCISTCTNDNPSNYYLSTEGPWSSIYCPGVLGSYNSNLTYSVGDVVIIGPDEGLSSRLAVTCCVDITTSEPFTESHWVEGYHPTLLGMYDPNRTYHRGDLIAQERYLGLGDVWTCMVETSTDISEFAPGAYPNILGVYDNTQAYNVGDIVYTGFETAGADCYTCYKNAPAGTDVFDTDYWISGYHENISGVYNPNTDYNIGDVLYDPESYYILTIVSESSLELNLINGYYPDLLGTYNSSNTYHAGDVITNSEHDVYVCTTASITGEWNYDYWYNIYTGYFKLSSILFEGTPETVQSDVFSNSGYNFILVPWEYGEGPIIDVGESQFVIYGYDSAESNNE